MKKVRSFSRNIGIAGESHQKKRIFSLCLWHSWITILYCWNGHLFFGRASCLFVLGVGGWVGGWVLRVTTKSQFMVKWDFRLWWQS